MFSHIPVQKKATFISLFISLIVLALKVSAYYTTRSSALFSDALETVINVVTAVIAIFVIRFSLEPADLEHPYGHGKIEYFSAAFDGGLIFFAGLAIIFDGFVAFFNNHQIKNIEIGLIYTLVATALNLFTGLYLIRTGKKNNSVALQANGQHLMADVKTTIGIFIGLVIFKFTDLIWIDPIMAILVGLWLLKDSFMMIKKNMGHLLDQTDIQTVKAFAEKINLMSHKNIIDIHNVRIIQSGGFQHIDAHLVVPEFLNIKSVHEIMDEFENDIFDKKKLDQSKENLFHGELAFHTDPCFQKYCTVCDYKDCPIRLKPFKNKTIYSADHLIQGPRYGK